MNPRNSQSSVRADTAFNASTFYPVLGVSRMIVLLLLLLLLARSLATAQSNVNISVSGNVWVVGIGSASSGLFGAECNPAHKITAAAIAEPACTANSPWTITLADGNSATPNPIVTGLVRDPLSNRIETGGGGVPTLNLNGLDIGPATLTITDPCNNSRTFAFNIVGCDINGAALVVAIGSIGLTAPNRAVPHLVHVENIGVNDSVSTTVEVTELPVTAEATVTSSDMTTGVGAGGKQKASATLGIIAAGTFEERWFWMQAIVPPAVVTDKFDIYAGFTSTYTTTDTKSIEIVASLDPNAKYGPLGDGALHDIPPGTVLPYTITFENSPSASAPAQIVTITDFLDTTKVEPTTLQFGTVYFGSKLVTPPSGVNPFSVTVPYDVDANPVTTADNIFVRITGSVDKNPASGTYGKVEWMFESLDAPGGNPPPINIGFLPANLTPPEGDGGVTFTVSPKPQPFPGTLITNVASIVFDVNAPILTPVWTNRFTPSTVFIKRAQTGMVEVTWKGGTLQHKSSVTGGNWSDAPSQISPWIFKPVDQQEFFRVRND